MASLEELASEYLVTPDGKNAADPCGAWCGDGDVDNWVGIVRRIQRDLVRTIKTNTGIVYPTELTGRATRWVMRSSVFRGGNITHVFGAGTDEVAGLVAFARQGVQILFEVQAVVELEGGTLVSPGPVMQPPKGGDEWIYVAGGVMLTLVLLGLWSTRG